MSSLNYLVVGGGILGSAIAERLAVRGFAVTLLDGDTGETSATVRTFGWINDAGINIPEYSALRTVGKLALAQRRIQDDEQGRSSTWYHQSGRLDWESADGRQELPAHQDAHRETIREEALRLSSQGQDAYVIAAGQIDRYDPTLDPATVEGDVLWVPEDAWVDLPAFADELRKQAVRAGGRIVRGKAESLLVADDGTVRGVRLDDGSELTADRTIVAAGEQTVALVRSVISIPSASTTGVTVITEPLSVVPRTILRAPFAGARPDEQGRLVIVADPLEDAVGEDRVVPSDVLERTLAHISSFLKGRPKLKAEQVQVGVRPIPGDGLPVVGAVPGTDGSLAVAFTHSGATVGYALARILVDELIDGHRAHVLSAFRPERFSKEA